MEIFLFEKKKKKKLQNSFFVFGISGATFSKFGVWNLSSNGVNDTSFFISIRNQGSRI